MWADIFDSNGAILAQVRDAKYGAELKAYRWLKLFLYEHGYRPKTVRRETIFHITPGELFAIWQELCENPSESTSHLVAWFQKWANWIAVEAHRIEKREEKRALLYVSSGAAQSGELEIPTLSDDLYEYQKVGVAWLQAAEGRGILGDDMGLGKTPQATAYCEVTPDAKRILVVAPSSVLINWEREGERWAPSIRWEAGLKGPHIKRLCKGEKPERWALIVSWAQVDRRYEELSQVGFDTVIADEAHYAKTLTAKRTQGLVALAHRAERRLLLTGTPMRNRPAELWPLLHILNPKEFPTFTPFGERYCGARNQRTRAGVVRTYVGARRLGELNEVTRPYLMRRLKSEVLTELPPKRRVVLPVVAHGSPVRNAFEALIARLRAAIVQGIEDNQVLGDLVRLRIQVGMEKVVAATQLIQSYHHAQEPLVVFLTHRDVWRTLSNQLDKLGIKHGSLIGSTTIPNRQKLVDQFQAGQLPVLICSEAGKEGITLTKACNVLRVERWWTPGDEAQSEDRCWRFGQKRAVVITILHLQESLDDHVANILEEKQNRIDTVMSRTAITSDVLRALQARL
jgi:SNF2 family DNA or RNA helicase